MRTVSERPASRTSSPAGRRRGATGAHSGGTTVLDEGLDAEGIDDVLTRLDERAGLEKLLTGHSPRRGLVTESARAGNDERQADKQGRWVPGSRVMRKYHEDDDGFKENALHGVL
jgi:hypothetical protein